jgi:CBS domain-containing protein
MKQMTEGKVRHVPVIEEERLVGIVSIGDVVKHRRLRINCAHDIIIARVVIKIIR